MKLKKKINDDLKDLFIGMLVLDLLAILISLFWGFNLPIILGFLGGYFYMCWNLYYLHVTIAKAINKTTDKAKKSMYSSYIFRYFVLFIILFICYYLKYISLIGVIIPLLFPKLVLGFNIFVKKRKEE